MAWRLQRGGRACAEYPRAGAVWEVRGGGEAGASLGCGVQEPGASFGEARCVTPPPPFERSVQDLRGAPTTPAPLLGTPHCALSLRGPWSAARG